LFKGSKTNARQALDFDTLINSLPLAPDHLTKHPGREPAQANAGKLT
jgi:hypothetical protein